MTGRKFERKQEKERKCKRNKEKYERMKERK